MMKLEELEASRQLENPGWPKPRGKTEEYRQEFTKKIISLMEQGEAFWQKPWKAPGRGLPVNGVSGKHYNGVNIAYLMSAAIDKGYTDPRWMTYKQAEEKGYQVRKGERGVKIEYYGEYDPTKTGKGADALDKKINDLMDKGASSEEIEKAMEDRKILYVKTYTVFNAAQIDGIEALTPAVPEEEEFVKRFRCHERAEKIMSGCGVPIQYGNADAAYNTKRDVIKMPNPEWFSTPEYFYSTVLHEIAHSTGHPSRMNREGLGEPFGSPKYAMEELRAEMASAFVFQEIGMPLSETDMEKHTEDHAAYAQHWLKSLRGDYKEFFKAVRDAAKIADYTLAYERAQNKALETKPNPAEPAIVDQLNGKETARTYMVQEKLIQATKAIMGRTTIVTSAQKGRTYTGEIVFADQTHAVQKIGAGRGIIHNLAKIDGHGPLDFHDKKKRPTVSITYDKENRGSVKSASSEHEEERDSGMSR